MKFLLILFLLFSFGYSKNQLNETELEIYKNMSSSDENEKYNEEVAYDTKENSSLVLRSLDYKKEYYVGEVFPIIIYAKTNEVSDFGFDIELDKNEDLAFLNKNLKWNKKGDEYEAILWFEAKTANAYIKNIKVSLTRNKVAFKESNLKIQDLRFKKINADRLYSNLVASKLEIKKVKTSYFDDKSLVMIVALEAQNANLNNFNITNDTTLIKQRVDNVNGDFNSSSAFYSAIFAPSKKELSFSYFNTDTNKLETVNLEVEISSNETVNTQSDLNPQSNVIDFYKQFILWFISGICAIFFIFKRSYLLLGVAVVCFALSFMVTSSSYKAVFKAKASAKLLPTSNSTYFYTSSQDEEVEVLDSRQNYKKILFKDGKIGWVDEKDLQEM